MKNSALMYEMIYRILKNKIESGVLPGGTKLPSRAGLCQEFDTSEKTVRHALKMLEEEGLIKTEKRKCPVVAEGCVAVRRTALGMLKRVDEAAANDILKTGILLCYPLNRHGMYLCKGADWDTPKAIISNMNPEKPTEFWRLSNRFWRYFITRNSNELIVRAVDSLGMSELDPLPGTLEMRKNYRSGLAELIETMERGGIPENVHFDDLFVLYGFLPDRIEQAPVYEASPDSTLCVGTTGLERRLRQSQERYSSVYLDILGLIAIGRYKPGDRLPSHDEMRECYGVSIDTTIKAIQTLREWGVVSAVRGKGIFVTMDLEALQRIAIPPDLIASHVRSFLDSLELLSITIEGVAVNAAERASRAEAEDLRRRLETLWTKEYLYQRSPFLMLEFIVDHIHLEALNAIYRMLLANYHIGRSIPKLIRLEKTPESCKLYGQCQSAVNHLLEGDCRLFAKETAEMFSDTRDLIIIGCKQLGYWEPAMNVYDGTALWK